jgi:ABC-type phosphonate transport system ATPase subunit
MEATDSMVSRQRSSEPEAFAPRPLLIGRGLTKVYRNGPFEVRALDGVDIDLYSGEIVVFLGESGSGKSTLLNGLGGLDVPTSGLLTYGNRALVFPISFASVCCGLHDDWCRGGTGFTQREVANAVCLQRNEQVNSAAAELDLGQRELARARRLKEPVPSPCRLSNLR